MVIWFVRMLQMIDRRQRLCCRDKNQQKKRPLFGNQISTYTPNEWEQFIQPVREATFDKRYLTQFSLGSALAFLLHSLIINALLV